MSSGAAIKNRGFIPMAEKTGISSALDAVGAGEPPRDDARQLDLIPDMRAPKGVNDGEEGANSGERRGPGRPPGARNKRTVETVDWIARKYGFPLERLAQFWSSKPEDLALELRIDREQAVELIKSSAIASLPYMHQKRPVEVDVHNHQRLTVVFGDVGGALAEVEQAAHDGVSLVLELDPRTGEYVEKSEG